MEGFQFRELDPDLNPLSVIQYVFNSGRYDLGTTEGRDKFTKDCCDELHNTMSPAWGYVSANSIMLLSPCGATGPGIYNIIDKPESPEAKPTFRYFSPVTHFKWHDPVSGAEVSAQEI